MTILKECCPQHMIGSLDIRQSIAVFRKKGGQIRLKTYWLTSCSSISCQRRYCKPTDVSVTLDCDSKLTPGF